MAKRTKAEVRAARRAALDAEYRRMVTGSSDGVLPAQIGIQASAGAARGGKGSAQRGKGKYG